MNTQSESTTNISLSIANQEKAKAFLEFLESRKALDPVLLKMDNSISDFMIIVTASSRRNAQALADATAEFCSLNHYELIGIEGYDLADWVLVDCNDILVNIFQESARDQYRLEELWKEHNRSARKEIH